MNKDFFGRKPFGGMFCRRGGEGIVSGDRVLSVECPWVDTGWGVGVLGGSLALGEWDSDRVVMLSNVYGWTWSVDAGGVEDGAEYKFVIVELRSGRLLFWEDGANRVYCGSCDRAVKVWRGDPQWRGAGVAIPLFSLRSEMSCGIGDFADLGRFCSWASQSGMRVVQLLPINDTTRTHTSADSYPYNAISVDALHPIYLSLEWMGVLQDPDVAHSVGDRAQRLNRLEGTDYEGVEQLKWDFFRAMYAQEGRLVLASTPCRTFVERNRSWLYPYALFSYLRDANETADFDTWGEWQTWDEHRAEQLLDAASSSVYDKIAIYLYLQFHADAQLKRAVRMAHTYGVALKGDIPIGVSRHSVDTWVSPELFNLDCCAGAPPDAFSRSGQNWGFPTYNWERMRADGYRWWRERFRKMEDFFDLYRVDHILGFFRIWEISRVCEAGTGDQISGLLGHFYPSLGYTSDELTEMGFALPLTSDRVGFEDVLFVADNRREGIYHPRIEGFTTKRYAALGAAQRGRYDRLYEDYFYRRNEAYWASCACDRLPALVEASGMTCCAEDLGMIPDCVAGVLADLEIVTLEVDRMPKQPGYLWGDVARYPYLSVATTSTHDTSTLRGWLSSDLAGDQEFRERYLRDALGLQGDLGYLGDPSEDVCRAAVRRILDSPSIFAILPLQDWLSVNEALRLPRASDERINDPSNPHHYWRYRMHLTIEQLQSSSDFNVSLRGMIMSSGRVVE